MEKKLFLVIALLFSVITISAQSYKDGTNFEKSTINFQADSLKTKQRFGVAIDLLPPVLSATTGHVGYSTQLWYGYKKFRVRGVIAGFQMPNKLIGNDDFKNLKTTATALIFDYFKKDNFEGWWIGAGAEIWNNKISSKLNNNKYKFNDYVATAGIGYIFKINKNFYIEPWGALHQVLNNERVTVDITEYKTKRLQGEVSLKIGWQF